MGGILEARHPAPGAVYAFTDEKPHHVDGEGAAPQFTSLGLRFRSWMHDRVLLKAPSQLD